MFLFLWGTAAKMPEVSRVLLDCQEEVGRKGCSRERGGARLEHFCGIPWVNSFAAKGDPATDGRISILVLQHFLTLAGDPEVASLMFL